MMLWLALRHNPDMPIGVLGIYSDRDKAFAACTSPFDCIGPLELDVVRGNNAEIVPWIGAYYPALEYKPEQLPLPIPQNDNTGFSNSWLHLVDKWLDRWLGGK
ncbi:hypothetical protein LCGC14_0386800 [marine sediment metagenome]|uniref:Uncharacterized protein n=1 Tax=marine sediment metagenome TaxID=412755 RepID=A0A0F9TIT5_9ZZZZ